MQRATTYTFTAPDDAVLDPDTDYFLYFEDTDVSTPHHDYAVFRRPDNTVAEGETGWSLGNRYSKTNDGSWSNIAGAIMIALKGNAAAPLPSVSFEQGTYTVVEGESATVKVILSEALDSAATITITSTAQDGATSSDYSGVPASVEFSAGETEKTFTFAASHGQRRG